AAKSAQDSTAARPMPPYQWPNMDEAKQIMRRATPSWVRKFQARKKYGIAKITNFSMPVKSLSEIEAIGIEMNANRKAKTVSPRAIETGIPVTRSAARMAKMMRAVIRDLPWRDHRHRLRAPRRRHGRDGR